MKLNDLLECMDNGTEAISMSVFIKGKGCCTTKIMVVGTAKEVFADMLDSDIYEISANTYQDYPYLHLSVGIHNTKALNKIDDMYFDYSGTVEGEWL